MILLSIDIERLFLHSFCTGKPRQGEKSISQTRQHLQGEGKREKGRERGREQVQ